MTGSVDSRIDAAGRAPEERLSSIKHRIRRIPVIGPALAKLGVWFSGMRFGGSASYWDERYLSGGSSGSGSYGELAVFKADVLNAFVEEHGIASVIELGCGDGNQLTLARYPQYLGFDVSRKAVALCRERFGDDSTKRFSLNAEYDGETADLALSLDVIFHLVEDEVFESYMRMLFGCARRFVVIYASNTDEQETPRPPHVRHRRFTDWVQENVRDFELLEALANRYPLDPVTGAGSPASFFIYARNG